MEDMKLKCWISICLLCTVSCFAFARPKVALVLSGGGAKGLAEIPLLEAIEKEGIKPDMILGTSMGALIGSLYASGYTPKEIRKILINMNYFELMSERPMAMERVPPEAFSQRANSALSLSFSIKGRRIGSAPGIIGDQNILCELSNYMSRVLAIDDFDKLPIPFRCVTTNVSTGETIVLNKGSIVDAVRASISLPGIFTPASLGDGRYAMDGGLRNNLPAKLAREMGADVVIAMDVASVTDKNPESLIDMTSAMEQLISLIITTNAVEQYKECTLILTPDLGKISTVNFFHPEEVISIGDACVEQNRDKIHQIAMDLKRSGYELHSLDEDRKGEYDMMEDFIIKKISIKDVSFEKTGPLPKESMFSKFIGKTLDDKVKVELTDMLCEFKDHYHFSSLIYGVKKIGDGKECELEIKANHYKQQSTKLYFSSSPSLFVSNKESHRYMTIDPTSTTGIYIDEPLESLFRFTTGNVMMGEAAIYPNLASWGGNKVTAELGGNFKSGSLEPKNSIFFNDRAVNRDYGYGGNLGIRFKYTDMVNLRIGAMMNADMLKSSGTWFSTACFYNEFIVTTLHNSYIKLSGVQLQLASYAGDASKGNDHVNFIYAIHFSYEQRFQMVKEWNSIGFSFELCNNRFPHEISSGYCNIGGTEGMCGYPYGCLKRDFIISGLNFKQRVGTVAGMPFFLVAEGKIAAFDSYEPFYSVESPSAKFFSGTSRPQVGAGAYAALDTPIGALVFGYSINSNNNWVITLALK